MMKHCNIKLLEPKGKQELKSLVSIAKGKSEEGEQSKNNNNKNKIKGLLF